MGLCLHTRQGLTWTSGRSPGEAVRQLWEEAWKAGRVEVLIDIFHPDLTESGEAERHPELAAQWQTGRGDVVLMRGGGWPLPTSRCPIHEAGQAAGERVTLTLRHNTGGFGADHFAST